MTKPEAAVDQMTYFDDIAQDYERVRRTDETPDNLMGRLRVFYCLDPMQLVLSPICSNRYLPCLWRLSTAGCCLYFCLVSSLIVNLSAQNREEEKLPPTNQNPILRDYFRKDFTYMGDSTDSRDSPTDPRAEEFIDQQIDGYVSELSERLALLKAHFAEVEREREAILELTGSQESREARVRLKDALEQVGDQAKDLWNMLRHVFTELKDRSGFKHPIDNQGKGLVFQKEIKFMREQIRRSEARIIEYFFEPNNTIKAEDLRGGNMLVHLYQVHRMTRELREHLRSSELECF